MAGLVLGIHLPGYAQEDGSKNFFTKFKSTFDGYVKNESAVRLDDPDEFVKLENSFELKYSRNFTDNLGITITGLAWYDGVFDVEDLHVKDEDEYQSDIDLREAFVDLTFDRLDIRLGKQQVVWGKTDGFRVTDVVNPLDMKNFVLDDFLDSRIPLWMGKAEYYFTTDFSLQVLVIPEIQFVEPAHAGSEYAFSSSSFPSGSVINKTDEPDENFENTEYGLKFTGFLHGWDFTLNYLYSWDDEPIVKKSLDSLSDTLTVSPEYERLHIVGGTFANVFWDTVIRGEIAAKIGKYFSVDDTTDPDMAVEKTLLNYALALERDVFDISWTVQFLQETILDYEDAIADDEINTRFTLRGSKDFMNEILEVEAFIVYGANEGEFLIRPSVEYDITDSTQITVGIDLFEGGDDESSFGQFDDKDRLYVELKYSF